MKKIMKMGKEEGLIILEDIDEEFRKFFGMVVREMKIRLMIGERMKLNEEVVIRDERREKKRFLEI